MLNLFTVFDLEVQKWPYIAPLMIIMVMKFMWKNSNMNTVKNMVYLSMISTFNPMKSKKWAKSYIKLMVLTFITVWWLNFISIFPYNFPLTSQISVVAALSIFLWAPMNILYMMKNLKGMILHLIPEGTPKPMTVFLFLVEMISNLIRPMTLTLRLVGNIVSGHIFLSLVYKMIYSMSNLLTPIYASYTLVEIVVSALQAYIMITLVVMYYSEV